jgi:hypothetical protein
VNHAALLVGAGLVAAGGGGGATLVPATLFAYGQARVSAESAGASLTGSPARVK